MINFFGEDVSIPDIDLERIGNWVSKTIESKDCYVADINFIFCSDNYLLSLNKKYLKHDYFTDILTFNYNEGEYISGDLFLSIERIKENSEKFNVLLNNEILRVCIHGVLHLLGHEDNTEAKERDMRLEEDKHLKFFFDVKKV